MTIITTATSKGGAGKTTIGRVLVGRLALRGYRVAVVDACATRALTDWVETAWKPPASAAPVTIVHELDETKIVPLVSSLHETHDVVLIDTAGAPNQATVFAIGCADLVLVLSQLSSADVVEAIKTMNLIKSAGLMMKKDILARVLLTAYKPKTNISEHIEREYEKAALPIMKAKLTDIVLFQEMTFTGVVPVSGTAGWQCSKLIDEIEELGALPGRARNPETAAPVESPRAAAPPSREEVESAAQSFEPEVKTKRPRSASPPYLARAEREKAIERLTAEINGLLALRDSGREPPQQEIERLQSELARLNLWTL
jgi:chromosome partitioning protein